MLPPSDASLSTEIENLHRSEPKDLFSILAWLLACFILPNLVVEVLFYTVQVVIDENWPQDSLLLLCARFSFASILLYVMLQKATPGRSQKSKFRYLKLKPSEANDVVYWSLWSLAFVALLHGVSWWVAPEPEPFLIDLQSQLNSPLHVAAFVFVSCVIAPVIEEIFIRGWFHQALEDNLHRRWATSFLTALVFTAMHAHYALVSTFVAIFAFALFLSWIRLRTGNVCYCILAHAMYNSAAVLLMIVFV